MKRFLFVLVALGALLPSDVLAQQATFQATGRPTATNAHRLEREMGRVGHLIALARPNYNRGGFVDPEGISGIWTEHSFSQTYAAKGGWLTGIEMGQTSGSATRLLLHWAKIENGELVMGTQLDGFYQNGGNRLTARVTSVVDPADASDPEQALGAVTGFNVCQSHTNGAVTGVSLQARFINNLAPRFVGLGGPASVSSFARPRCDQWAGPFISCPTGQVVIGVQTHGSASPSGIIGMGPICSRLEVNG